MNSPRSPGVHEDIPFSDLPSPPVSKTFDPLPVPEEQKVADTDISIPQISLAKRAQTAPSTTKYEPKHHFHVDDYSEEPIYDDTGAWKAGDPLLKLKGKKHNYERLEDEAEEDGGAIHAKKTGSWRKADIETLNNSKPDTKERRKRHLDLAQRILSLCISIIIVGAMSHALIVFDSWQNVTAGGERIYPTFMVLWPTYLMIASAAITVVLNACIVYWRTRGTLKDQAREEMYNKMWDYALHGINGVIWLGTTTTFGATKNMKFFGAEDPNVLFGYVCSTTATNLSQTFPQIVRFQAQCEIQNVSFWMSVSAIMVEGFSVAAKVFLN